MPDRNPSEIPLSETVRNCDMLRDSVIALWKGQLEIRAGEIDTLWAAEYYSRGSGVSCGSGLRRLNLGHEDITGKEGIVFVRRDLTDSVCTP